LGAAMFEGLGRALIGVVRMSDLRASGLRSSGTGTTRVM
jgi:hypothetical protein